MKFNLPDPYMILFNLYERFGNSPYLKLAVVLVGIFIFVVLLAYVREHIFKISMKGAVFGFFLGAILMLVLDVIIIAAFADKAKIQELFLKEKRQEILGELMFSGITNLNKILGASTTMISPPRPKTAQEVISGLLSLPGDEAQKVKDLICPR